MGKDDHFNVLAAFAPIAKSVLTETHELFWNAYENMRDWANNTSLCWRFATLPFRTLIVLVALPIYLVVMVIEAALVAATFLFLIVGSILFGIWPAFIGTVAFLAIICIQTPICVYVYLGIIYRTVTMTSSLKVVFCVGTPILFVVTLPTSLVIIFFILFICCLFICLRGYGQMTWIKMKWAIEKFWKYIVENKNKMRETYDDANGVPDNWDGSVYALPINPGMFLINIVGYLAGFMIITPCVWMFTTFKSWIIFLRGVYEFWKRAKPCKFFTWYFQLLRGHKSTQTVSQTNTKLVGHAKWINCLKRLTKKPKNCVESFRTFDVFEKTTTWITNYSCLKDFFKWKIFSAPFTAFNEKYPFCKVIGEIPIIAWIIAVPSFLCLMISYHCVIFCLWGSLFVLLFILVIGFFPVVALTPLAYWILGWIFVVFVLPILYFLTWILVFIVLWIATFVYSLSGPLWAIKIPIFLYKSNFKKPFRNLKRVLESIVVKIIEILIESDDFSANYSIANFKFCCCQTGEDQTSSQRRQNEEGQTSSQRRRTEENQTSNQRRRTEEGQTLSQSQRSDNTVINVDNADNKANNNVAHVPYWDHYSVEMRSTIETVVNNNCGLTSEDVEEMSSLFFLSIPGISILKILIETNKRNKNNGQDDAMIYWRNANVVCNHVDEKDNIAKVFLPKILDIKDDLKQLDETESDVHIEWIMAMLCDKQDKKTETLPKEYKKFLACEEQNWDNDTKNVKLTKRAQDHSIAKKIYYKLVSLTLSLIRVKRMKEVLKAVVAIFGSKNNS